MVTIKNTKINAGYVNFANWAYERFLFLYLHYFLPFIWLGKFPRTHNPNVSTVVIIIFRQNEENEKSQYIENLKIKNRFDKVLSI